jgi:ABC-type phosphate/phosphonate transport system substrate-binding protein
VIDVLGPSPIQPVVVARQAPDSLKVDLEAILLAMGEDTAAQQRLAHGFVERFASVVDSDYDPIRTMLAAAEAIGFMKIR